MKKVLFGILLLFCLIWAMPTQVSAEHYYGDDNWSVTFTPQEKMVSNFTTGQLTDKAAGLQPGDDLTITVQVKNTHSERTNWYMANKVLRSLEDSVSAAKDKGGAYSYKLTYKNSQTNKETVLYDSDQVGGAEKSDAGEGLNEATNALDDFFYLDSFAKNEGGVVTLFVALEGESQGNLYQDTLADLQMNFAVELESDTGKDNTTPSRKAVQTGDYLSILPYVIIAAVSGLVLLFLAMFQVKRRRDERKGA